MAAAPHSSRKCPTRPANSSKRQSWLLQVANDEEIYVKKGRGERADSTLGTRRWRPRFAFPLRSTTTVLPSSTSVHYIDGHPDPPANLICYRACGSSPLSMWTALQASPVQTEVMMPPPHQCGLRFKPHQCSASSMCGTTPATATPIAEYEKKRQVTSTSQGRPRAL